MHFAQRWMECGEKLSQRHASHCNPDASAYPMNPFWPTVTDGHNTRVFSQNRRPTEQEETATLRLEGDMQHDAWYWHWVGRILPPGYLQRFRWSASTLTEPVRPDRAILHRWKNNWLMKALASTQSFHIAEILLPAENFFESHPPSPMLHLLYKFPVNQLHCTLDVHLHTVSLHSTTLSAMFPYGIYS